MKKFLIIFSAFILCFTLCACDNSGIQKKGPNATSEETDILLTMNQKSNAQNQIWVGTFQLVWNDLIDTINNGKPVELIPSMPQSAIELNKKQFSTDYISEDSYYLTHGIFDEKLVNTIKKDIKKKFNETSDILDNLTPNHQFMIYSMLKKDFKFKNPFDKLEDEPFNTNPNKIKYFGINNDSNNKLRENVKVVNYKNNNNYIIKLLTKSNDEVILYRTDEDKTLDKYWNDIKSFNQESSLGSEDKVKIPYLDFFYKKSFIELIEKRIKGTDFVIGEALETVDFKMDEAGVKLKSEAVIVQKNAIMVKTPHNYYFDKPFTLFLIEKDKTTPYFGARIKDVDEINKR